MAGQAGRFLLTKGNDDLPAIGLADYGPLENVTDPARDPNRALACGQPGDAHLRER